MLIEKLGEFFKVDGRLIYGWALVCEQRNASGEWERYVDKQNDHIPEDVMVAAALDFAKNSRVGKDMHAGEQVASVPLVYVVTKSSSKLGIETKKTGMLIGWEPDDPALLDSVAKGERTGFSIGGFVTESENGELGKVAKSDGGEAAKGPRIFRQFQIREISLVDQPAMEGATIGYVKNADGTSRRVIATASNNSTRSEPLPEPACMANEPDTTKQQITDLTKRAERAERIAKMSGAHKTHYDRLTGDDAEVFLGKSTAERESEVQKALEADKPIWTGEVTKVAVRARDGELALQLAKQNEANAVALAKREAEIEKAEVAAIAKRTLGSVAGGDDVHAYIVTSIRKGGGDAAMIEKALTTLSSVNDVAKSAAKPPGFNPELAPTIGSPEAQLEVLAKQIATDQKVDIAKARALVFDTEEGAALYAQIEKRKQALRTGASA